MELKIVNRWDKKVIIEGDFEDVKSLIAANRNADLSDADLRGLSIVPQGTFKAYKKASGKVVELIIPANAKRTSSLVGSKCRCEFAYVKRILDVYGSDSGSDSGLGQVHGDYGRKTIYELGKKVTPDKYDDDIRVECTHGIHFFITFEEAANYN